MSRWYRAYAGTIKDDKLAEVAVIAGCSRSVSIAVWHAILESAAETDDGGRFETTPRRVAAALCEPLAAIQAVFDAMTEIAMIGGDSVTAWKRFGAGRLDDFRMTAAWAEIRAAIFARDGFRCTYCGSEGGRLECDHIVPMSRGGGHEPENLTTACASCNRSKRDKTLEEWLQ